MYEREEADAVMADMNRSSEKVVDLRGKECPYTLLDLEREIGDVSNFERIVVLSDYEPAVEETIPAFCEKRGLKWHKKKISEGQWQIIIECR